MTNVLTVIISNVRIYRYGGKWEVGGSGEGVVNFLLLAGIILQFQNYKKSNLEKMKMK